MMNIRSTFFALGFLFLVSPLARAGNKEIDVIVKNDLKKGESESLSAITVVVDYATSKTSYASRKVTIEDKEIPKRKSAKNFDLFLSNTDKSLLIHNVTLMVQWARHGRPPCEIRKEVKLERSNNVPFYPDIVVTLSDFSATKCET